MSNSVLVSILIVSSIFLIYIYGGYSIVLFLFSKILKRDNRFNQTHEDYFPGITVYFSALNEEENVKKRILNLLNCGYPKEKLEIIVVSDGSTDKTVGRVEEVKKEYKDYKIRVIVFEENKGRAAAQNKVSEIASNEILIATDAETMFGQNYLQKIVQPFYYDQVGVVCGITEYDCKNSEIAKSIGIHRKMEHKVRDLQQKLGVMVKTDGNNTAYRKEIWTEIKDFEDVDQLIVLLARKKGFKAVQVNDAVCYEIPNLTTNQELKSRARMTRKGLLTMFNRWKFSDIVKDPFFSFNLISHKYVRYSSPIFVFLFISDIGILIFQIIGLYNILLLVVLLFLIVIINKVYDIIPVLNSLFNKIYSFLLANIGFSKGIIGWLTGNKEGRYKPTKDIE